VDGLFTNFGYGIILGLFLGKLIGITFKHESRNDA
jgi:tetrahydromethanopterin S-methyltransferase subunit B